MKHTIILLLLVFAIIGCDRFNNKDKKTENQERIVCISKQYSEIIYALGAQKDLVAVDLSSTYPAEIKELPTIGYHRALSAETILAMNPTMILQDNNIGPENVVSQLVKLKIPMKNFGEYQSTIEGTDSLIREMGVYFQKENVADSLCKKLQNDMGMALEKVKQYSDTPKVLIIHFGRASNVYLVMTKNSTAGKMIEWAGGEMAIDGEKGMTQLSPEIVAAANPDIILLTDYGYDQLSKGNEIEKLPGIASTKAFKNKHIFRIEEHDLVYLGPRTGENVLVIQNLIHPKDEK